MTVIADAMDALQKNGIDEAVRNEVLDKLGAALAFTVAPLKELAALVVPSTTPAQVPI
jgi:hypothetical protein